MNTYRCSALQRPCLCYLSAPPQRRAMTGASPTFKPGQPRMLFSIRGYYLSTNYADYDVTADDQRFVMIRTQRRGGP